MTETTASQNPPRRVTEAAPCGISNGARRRKERALHFFGIQSRFDATGDLERDDTKTAGVWSTRA